MSTLDKRPTFDSPKTGFKLALFATVLAFCVVVLGAYTRLTDAGLGCPDWPQCYGKWIVSLANTGNQNVIDITKAWTEMAHRYLAGLLGISILTLAFLSFRNRRCLEQPLLLPLGLVLLVIFQAALGMWTVTLKLFPMVVMAHLLGGFTTLSLLWWLCLTLKTNQPEATSMQMLHHKTPRYLKIGALFALFILITQLFLGGWTSATYSALVCTDFPLCHGQSFLNENFWEAFHITSIGITGSPGEPLQYSARVTIHMIHRIGAVITAIVLGWLIFQVYSSSQALRRLCILMATFLMIQLLLGILNILALLPLAIAVAHNAVAALLLLALVTLNYDLLAKPKKKFYVSYQ